MKKNLIYVVGPTASGKTSLGVNLALKYNAEVVSADSMQIYKGISIATAAPKLVETMGIKHHLTEFLDLDTAFSVADYVELARNTIDGIFESGKNCIVVGGTGLYINSLADNIVFVKEETDLELRSSLTKEMEEIGAEAMLEYLSSFDPVTAKKLHPNNKRRIIRAIEVYKTTGKTFSEQNELSKAENSPYNSIMIGITYRQREKLYERIDKRVDLMLEDGLLNEAEKYLSLKLGSGAAQAIGHKELSGYLKGECSLDEAVDNLKRATRRYAKRQLTWFKKDERINWIYADETENATEEAIKILERELN